MKITIEDDVSGHVKKITVLINKEWLADQKPSSTAHLIDTEQGIGIIRDAICSAIHAWLQHRLFTRQSPIMIHIRYGH